MATAKITKLSPKEVEVVKLIASGKSQKEIAKKLEITVNTLNGYITVIVRKLPESKQDLAPMKRIMIWAKATRIAA